jgi:Patatin-like phospholipase
MVRASEQPELREAPLPPPEPPKPKCDLIMKGGITSGIVYPPALFELQKHYVFRNIGGTSAGAVAAVGAAAAEYNRDGDGFDHLQTRGVELGGTSKIGDGSTLRNLFQASPDTQPLMDILNAMLIVLGTDTTQATSAADSGPRAPSGDGTGPPTRRQLKSSFLRLIQSFTPSALDTLLALADQLAVFWSDDTKHYKPFQTGSRIGIIWGSSAGIVLAVIASLCVLGLVSLFVPLDTGGKWWVLLLAFLILGSLAGVVGGWLGRGSGRVVAVLIDVFDLVSNRLKQNYYGICLGHTPTDGRSEPDGTNLTDWLSDTIQDIAGRPRDSNPLTFGELIGKGIDLKLVTSNLSHGVPYILPDNLHNFLFQEDDMRALFPVEIVQHLMSHPPTDSDDPEKQLILPQRLLPEKYHYLPDMKDLPVLFGARLSLSFPFLLSAVPLYTISTQAFKRYQQWSLQEQKEPGKQAKFALDQPGDLQKNWFSDGGISSNFPMQFFDAWLPLHPTFGINLTTAPNATSTLVVARKDDQGSVPVATDRKGDIAADSYVYLPGAADRQDPEWQDIESPVVFAQAILGTSMNYRDTMQANLPSYRERIVQVRLAADEGGLNLTMPARIIEAVMNKGQEAGVRLSPSGAFNFDHHWWVRFLVLMDQLEQNIALMQQILDSPTPSIEQRIERQLLTKDAPYPYPRDRAWCNRAKIRVKALQDLIQAWHEVTASGEQVLAFHDRVPTPNPILRLTPEV